MNNSPCLSHCSNRVANSLQKESELCFGSREYGWVLPICSINLNTLFGISDELLSPLRRFPRRQTSSIRSLQCSQPNRSTNEHISNQYASCRIIHTTTPYPQTFPARRVKSRQVVIDEIESLTISRQISAKSLFWVCSWSFSNFSRHLIQNGYKIWLFANVFSPWSSSGRMSCTAARNLQKGTGGYLWDEPSSMYVR